MDKLSIEDTNVTITVNLVDENNSALDLTNASTVFLVVNSGKRNEATKQMTIEDPATDGEVTVQPDAGMLQVGVNKLKVEVNWSGGTKSVTITDWEVEGLQ